MSILDDVEDYISKPFKTGEAKVIGEVLSSVGKQIFPVEIIDAAKTTYNTINTASQRHVHVANATGMPIAVIVSANSNWVYADLGAAVVSLVVSFGTSAPAGLAAMRNATTLWEFYQASRCYRGIAGLATPIYNLFANKGTSIEPGQYVDVAQRSNSNPLNYLDPSQYAAFCKANDLTLMIMRQDGLSAIFNTNSDTSWIAYPSGYCRAKYGTLWDAEDEPHAWDAG